MKTKNIPEPEKDLPDEIKAVWYQVFEHVPEGYFGPQHYGLVRMFCSSIAMHKNMVEKLHEHGPYLKNTITGKPYQSPYYRMMRKAEKNIVDGGRCLGFDIDIRDLRKPGAGLRFWEPVLKIVGENKKNA